MFSTSSERRLRLAVCVFIGEQFASVHGVDDPSATISASAPFASAMRHIQSSLLGSQHQFLGALLLVQNAL